jgi:hypothetical protein
MGATGKPKFAQLTVELNNIADCVLKMRQHLQFNIQHINAHTLERCGIFLYFQKKINS